jgi:hypothetical protein
MYKRTMMTELLRLAGQYPVVSIMGPRQSGKTTLIKKTFLDKAYVNLEVPDLRLAAKSDPKGFLNQYPQGLILDEIQRVPELLSYIQVIVDEDRVPGKYILSGSHQIALHEAVSQSLAGRVGLLNLFPLTQTELKNAGFNLELNDQIYHGFYPGIYHDDLNPTQAYRFYVQTYLEKDVRQISQIQNLITFQNFMKICAGRIGQIIDYASMANQVGISANTIKNWISVLEASYIIIRLKPYFENFGKRVIKAPKLYFTDVGLAAYLLDIEKASHISRDPLRGHLVENLSVMELYKYRHNRGLEPNIYYYRDSQQNEVDVIIKQGNLLTPIEIKSAQTFDTSFLKGIKYFKKLAGERINKSFLVYSGDVIQTVSDIQLLNYRNVTSIYDQIA